MIRLFDLGGDEPRERRVTRSERRENEREAWPSSLWRDGNRRFHFPSPATDIGCNVLIIGAGFTGLWTALSILRAEPGTSVVIVDMMQPGYGASGRNGGWCSSLLPMSPMEVVRTFGVDGAAAMRGALENTVARIGEYGTSPGRDIGWAHNGSLTVATNEQQAHRMNREVTAWSDAGATGVSWLESDALEHRIRVPGAMGAMHDAHCGVLNPYALVDSLVQDVVDAGARIFGGSRVTKIGNGFAEVEGASGLSFVTADRVVVATEAYTTRMKGRHRSSAPVYSYVLATEPLSADAWDEIGWSGREALAEATHLVSYAQRTRDGRIVLGGRGAPYAFGSDIHASRDTHARVHRALEDNLRRHFPAAGQVRVSHRWGGPVAVPRDMQAGVHVDPDTGAVHVGGYAGDGVALSHLAGRIAAHIALGTDGPELDLPLHSHWSRSWEPEPLRWIGINAALWGTKLADRAESAGSEPGRLARVALGLSGT